jgi:trimeric autotransporter adhesin
MDSNTTGDGNTAIGDRALYSNTRGNNNTAIGAFANMIVANLTNATAIGAAAIVNADNNIRQTRRRTRRLKLCCRGSKR